MRCSWRTAGGAPSLLHIDDGPVFKIVHTAPAGKRQKRLIIWVSDKHPFQPVTICVIQHGAECVEASLAEIFRIGKRTAAVLSQFRQRTPGVPFAIDAAGVGRAANREILLPNPNVI